MHDFNILKNYLTPQKDINPTYQVTHIFDYIPVSPSYPQCGFAPKTGKSDLIHVLNHNIKLMKGIAIRKHGVSEKTAASVLLKLFISSNE